MRSCTRCTWWISGRSISSNVGIWLCNLTGPFIDNSELLPPSVAFRTAYTLCTVRWTSYSPRLNLVWFASHLSWLQNRVLDLQYLRKSLVDRRAHQSHRHAGLSSHTLCSKRLWAWWTLGSLDSFSFAMVRYLSCVEMSYPFPLPSSTCSLLLPNPASACNSLSQFADLFLLFSGIVVVTGNMSRTLFYQSQDTSSSSFLCRDLWLIPVMRNCHKPRTCVCRWFQLHA